jgi:hemolysin activation/secretion protein
LLAWAICAPHTLVPALAQTAPDAGSTLRQLEPPTLTLPRKPPAGVEFEVPARPVLAPAPALRFTLRAFRITGATAFPESELLQLIQDYVGREVGIAELGEAVSRITRFYAQRGYPLATAYLPAQDIKEGVVELVVLEGRFGRVQLLNRSRVRDGVIASYLDALPGRLVEEAMLERQLLLVYDLPGVVPAKAVLAPGQAVGETDLRLELDSGRAAAGSLEFDNYGNRFSGANQLSAQLDLSGPARLGDAASVRIAKGDPGLEYARASYQLPVGGQGLRAGAAYSAVRYRLGGSFAALAASGEAQTATGFLQYPFVRSRQHNLNGRVAYEQRDLQDRLDTATDKTAKIVTATLSGDAFDAVGGGGASAFSIGYTRGELNIETPFAKAIDDVTARTDGGYHKWNLSFVRLQHLTERVSAYVAFHGQKAGGNLDSSEKLILGGINGVRAYPQGEAPGDSGYLLSGELRYAFSLSLVPGSFQWVGFVDTGQVTLSEEAFVAGLNRRRLSGGGIGLNWSRVHDFALRLAVAHRIGNSRATAGSDAETRGWLQAIKFF